MAKAIFVDGASLSCMRYGLGINQFEFKMLYQILTEEVGTQKKIFGKPFYTVAKDGSDGSWIKSLRSRGFETAITDTEGGQDDQLIIDRIKALRPEEVSEIVLVSADQDFVPILLDKKKEGISVYWVATKNSTESGVAKIGEALDDLFSTEFKFVELADYKDRLMRTPWIAKPKPEPPTPKQRIVVTLHMETTHDDRLALFNDVMEITKKYPFMKYTIEG